MNLEELKPLWESYKEQTGEQLHWTDSEIARIIQQNTTAYPWLLNFCMTILLITVTGC
ncbi:hypothetical protein [Xanthocytophaga flava]|uniref:hypothetical protein n=1 Tax=Xanthocytophaga flava TaxID=3048013 RepID=UPI0028D86162|nr:hypothetical protein [Xanthocytophaga flavus]MDJ1473619.1 hypothetical protein [Xanthocytophaga flavus]